MTSNPSGQGARVALTLGVAALFGGLWLLLNAYGVGVPPFKRLWPTLLVLAGGAALADYLFFSRKPTAAGWALAWTGFGVLGFALTLGYSNWLKILDWLPSFPMILGLSFLATWLADDRRNQHLVIAGGVLVGLGLTGFAARFEWLRLLLPSAQVFWAGLLLLGGGYLVWRAIARSRR